MQVARCQMNCGGVGVVLCYHVRAGREDARQNRFKKVHFRLETRTHGS
jgi:uncharacterized protein (DUF849 family)